MADAFATPDDDGSAIRATDLHASLGEQLGAEFTGALDPKNSLSTSLFVRGGQQAIAGGFAPGAFQEGMPAEQSVELERQSEAAVPDTGIDEAKDRVKQAGLDGHLKLPDQPSIKAPVLDMMIQEAQERRDREAAIARGPQGFYPDALGLITSIGAGMIDPVNAAAFSIPVVGEARWGKIIASAGDSIAARTALNVGKGAAQAAVGTAVLQPADWWLHTRDGQDYTFTDALKQVALGATMGGVAHAGFGAIGDVRARLRGEPLEGSPTDLLMRRALGAAPEVPVGEDAVPAAPGLPRVEEPAAHGSEGIEMIHPSELYGDLPPAAQQDALRATMADMIDGQLPQPMEMLRVAADHSARIAESVDAYNEGNAPVPVTPPSPRGRAAADPQTWSLYEFLAREGGLKPDPELEAIFGNAKGPFVPGFGALVRPGGRALDDALRLAKDHGYLFDAADVTGAEGRLTPRDLLDRLAEENAGRRQYRGDQALSTKGEEVTARERETHEIISHLHEELESASGQPHSAIDPKLEDRVVEIMRREGEKDVLAAFERAIMEDAERYEGLANARHENADLGHIPGWDADELAAASGHGGDDPGQRGPAGLPASGSGAGNGGQPRDAGGGNRAAGPAALARDRAFQQLGDRPPAYDAPEDVENSRWADNLPEPASVDPKKSAAALQQAVAEAEQVWRDLEPYLSEDERRVFNDALEALDRDTAANAQVLKDGAACLAAAVG